MEGKDLRRGGAEGKKEENEGAGTREGGSAGARELEAPPGGLPRGPRVAPKQASSPPPLRGLIVVFGGHSQ